MRITPIVSGITAAAIAVPLALGTPSPTVGRGAHTCTLHRGADCHGITQRWTVEHHGDLRAINLKGADVRGADLRGANASRADLRGAVLRHADLRDATLRAADLRGATLAHVDLRGAHAHGARFGTAPHRGATTGARRAARETGITCVPNCAGQDIDEGDTILMPNAGGADFQNSEWRGLWVVQGNFAGANFVGAWMSAWFDHGDFTGANLSYVHAEGAAADEWHNADGTTTVGYRHGDFAGSTFRGADMRFSDFHNAWFTNADLTNANLRGANIAGTDFTGATFSNTICPDGATTNTGC